MFEKVNLALIKCHSLSTVYDRNQVLHVKMSLDEYFFLSVTFFVELHI